MSILLRASRKLQLESMTREDIIAVWMYATRNELSGATTVQRMIDEVLNAEFPAKASMKTGESPDV